jgi:hypothetical protein
MPREGGASGNHYRRGHTARSAITGSSACADDDNYPTFSPTKSVSSLRVISGANQMNSGAGIRTDSAQDWADRSETHQIREGKTMGSAKAQPILPRSSPAVVSRLARRTGRQTSGAARWATGRRAIAGGDGATRITGGDGATRIIGRRIGIAGATMHGRGRGRQHGAENDCGGERDCCPARHFVSPG